jgi:hypothetical protein
LRRITVGVKGGIMKNWTWGLSLIALTIVIHATGIALLAPALQCIRDRMQSERLLARRRALTISIMLIGATGLLLAVLHGIEAGMWAIVYWCLGPLRSPGEAMLFSVDSITTRGAAELMLEQQWQMMGALEAADGMLLFGISTAFIFGDASVLVAHHREPSSTLNNRDDSK